MDSKHVVITCDPEAFTPEVFTPKPFKFKIPSRNGGWEYSKLYAITASNARVDVTQPFQRLMDAKYQDRKDGNRRRFFATCLACGKGRVYPHPDYPPPNIYSPWHCISCDQFWLMTKPSGIVRFYPEILDAMLVGAAVVMYGDATDHNGEQILRAVDARGNPWIVTPWFKYVDIAETFDSKYGKIFKTCLCCGCCRTLIYLGDDQVDRTRERFHCDKCLEHWNKTKPVGLITHEQSLGQKLDIQYATKPSTGDLVDYAPEKTDGIEKIKEEQKDDCAICLSQRADVVYINCQHLCICHDCLKTYKKDICPICKTAGKTLTVHFN